MQNGEYRDDPAISDSDALWRRIPPVWIIFDENRETHRPSSAAFDDSTNGSPMSVVIEQIARGPEQALAGFEGFGMVWFTAGTARQCNQGIAKDPQPEEPAHGLVFGKKSQSVKRKLRDASQWVVLPRQ